MKLATIDMLVSILGGGGIKLNKILVLPFSQVSTIVDDYDLTNYWPVATFAI